MKIAKLLPISNKCFIATRLLRGPNRMTNLTLTLSGLEGLRLELEPKMVTDHFEVGTTSTLSLTNGCGILYQASLRENNWSISPKARLTLTR